MKWLLLILGIVANASASILIKVAVQPPRSMPNLLQPLEALRNWPFWLGLAFYGAAFLLYAAVLSRLPMHVAHPVLTGGAIAAVALSSVLLFGEPMNWLTGLGILLVIVGVFAITSRAG